MLLNCHTYYSFGYGTLSPEELLALVKAKGYSSFALTDINNTSAVFDTLRLSKEHGLKPVIGIDFRPAPPSLGEEPGVRSVKQHFVGLTRNNEGFRELNEHLTSILSARPHEVASLSKGEGCGERCGLFQNCFIIYPLANYHGQPLAENEFIGVSIKDLPSLPFNRFVNRNQETVNRKLVCLQTLSFENKKHFNAHRLLRAIDQNTLLSKLSLTEQATINDVVVSHADMRLAYAQYPEMIRNTERILEECTFEIEFGKFANKNPKHYTTSIAEDKELLRSECEKNLSYRYPVVNEVVRERLERELFIISEKKYNSYFLINWDIINYARHKNYYYVGRGSGANSMVAYLLRITDVDPIDLDLYFERFINLDRETPPDFDIDFSWLDRDDITRYIFDRFGRDKTALLGTYATYQHDAVIRQLGKVFGLPPGEIDRLQRTDRYPDVDEMGKLVLRYSELIKGFPSHLSIHSSGIVISEKPINCYCATNLPPKGYPTTQFSMQEAEDIGLHKFDILSQRGLGKIKDALEIIRENKGEEIDIHDVKYFMQDETVKEMLREGKAIGCFYVESPAMRMLLAKLRADDYLRLVAASSIIRPGVARSGMMREYIVRYRDMKARERARAQLPEFYDILEETYGVMVYQEDVIKVAHFFAGLSLAEADHLRRGMSWKFKQRNEFWKVREKFFSNCIAKKHPEKLIGNMWAQIESFANFAFSKGHSASYAVESYQALYLKAHFPLEYITATLNNGGGFYRRELYVHEARMHGAKIKAPCINTSNALCVIKGKTIYLGLGMISELEENVIRDILVERNAHGSFKDMYDFVKRVPVSIEQMRLLVRAGTFAFTGSIKKKLLWEAHALIQPVKIKVTHDELFEVERRQWKLPEFSVSAIEEAFDEMDLFGFSLTLTPFELLRDPIPDGILSGRMKDHIGQHVTMVGYMITVKNASTIKGDRMYFGTFIDQEGEWIDTVHFPPSARAFPFTGPGCYVIRGKVVEEYDFVSMEVAYMKRLPVVDREI